MTGWLRRAAERRRRGAIALLAVVALIPVATLYAASMNGGQAVHDRQHAQDAADALARMHATWSARSLNTISMNNVEAAQLLTVAIGSEALESALWELNLRANVAIGTIAVHSLLCFGYRRPWRIAWCLREHYRYTRPAREARRHVSGTRSRFDPAFGIRTAHRGLRAIDAMNERIVARFPAAIGDMAEDYRRSLKVDALHFADPCQGEGEGCRAGASAQGLSLIHI